MEPWIAGRNPVRLKDADGNRDAQSSLTPTVWVTSLPMWLQDTTVRNTCCIHFYPLVFAQSASLAGQLTSHALSSSPPPDGIGLHWIAAGHNHHLTRTTRAHTTSLAKHRVARHGCSERPIVWAQGTQKTHKDPRIYPGPRNLWNDRLPSCWLLRGKHG